MQGKDRFIMVCLIVVLGVFLVLPALAAPTKITFWYSYGGRNREVTEELIKRFNESQPRYRVEGSFQGGYWEALAKFRVAVVSKTAPTIIHVPESVIPKLYDAGILENLDEYARSKNPVNLNDFTPALTQDGTWDYLGGEKPPLVSIPFNRSTPVMYTNKEMLAKKGVAIPTTWDELRQAARKLTVKDSAGKVEVYGFEVPIDWWFWLAMLYQGGGQLISEDGSRAVFEKQGTEAIQFWVDMVNEEIMKHPPGKDFNSWEVANNDFINERAAIIWTSTAFLSYLTDNCPFTIQCAFLPKKVKYGVPTGGTYFIVWEGASQAEKDGAWAFLKWITELDQTLYWSQSTGYMPVRLSAINSSKMIEFYQKNPNFVVTLDQLENALQFPWSPALNDIHRQVIDRILEGPVVGVRSAKETMQEAIKEADKFLARYK